MTRRFFSETQIEGKTATLAGAEAHHLIHVIRAETGTQLTLFDGSGDEFDAVVTAMERTSVVLQIVGRQTVDREPVLKIRLAVALPKGDRQKWLVEKCVELGVHALIPLATERSVAQPTGNAIERLRRSVIEASKQCGRNRLMQIEQPRPIVEYSVAEAGRSAARWIAHPSGDRVENALAALEQAEVDVMIGPEGGFTEEEVQLARDVDWQVVSLGPRNLRIETAALAIVAQISLRSESRSDSPDSPDNADSADSADNGGK